jgi:hypothetical protein
VIVTQFYQNSSLREKMVFMVEELGETIYKNLQFPIRTQNIRNS